MMIRHDRKGPIRPTRFVSAPVTATHRALAGGVAWALAPSAAWALCPNCLGQSRSLTPTIALVGGFLLIPFVVFMVVLRVIRRAGRLDPAASARRR